MTSQLDQTQMDYINDLDDIIDLIKKGLDIQTVTTPDGQTIFKWLCYDRSIDECVSIVSESGISLTMDSCNHMAKLYDESISTLLYNPEITDVLELWPDILNRVVNPSSEFINYYRGVIDRWYQFKKITPLSL